MLALTAVGVVAQSVISSHSGLVLIAEGTVFLEDKPILPIGGRFPGLANGEILRTQEGRVEMLLGPGVFLWLGPNSAVRMTDNNLADAHLELVTGKAILQAPDLAAGNAVTVSNGDRELRAANHKRYRMEAGMGHFQVTEGYSQKPDELDQWSWKRLQTIWAENLKSARLIARAERNKRHAHGVQRPYPGPVLALPGRT